MPSFDGGADRKKLLFLIKEKRGEVMEIGERLQYLRKAKGISQEKLAEQLHVTRQAISKWENGQSYSDLDNLKALCEFYGVTADYIIKGEDVKNQKTTFDKRVKLIIFGVMSGIGAVLCCLLPLFASIYQQSEANTWSSWYTNANDYITEWPILGILIIALALLFIGITGLILSFLQEKYKDKISAIISDWFSGW